MAMTYRDIIVLLNAGYTKADIDAMSDDKPAEATKNSDVQEHSEPVNVPQNGTSPASDPVETTEPAKPENEYDRLTKQLAELTAAVQNANRAGAEMGGKIISPHETGINALRELGGVPANA